MPALVLLLAALGLNYDRHLRGKSTICSTLRRFIGPRQMILIVSAAVGWFLPHYCRPFRRVVAAALEAFDDDNSTLAPEES